MLLVGCLLVSTSSSSWLDWATICRCHWTHLCTVLEFSGCIFFRFLVFNPSDSWLASYSKKDDHDFWHIFLLAGVFSLFQAMDLQKNKYKIFIFTCKEEEKIYACMYIQNSSIFCTRTIYNAIYCNLLCGLQNLFRFFKVYFFLFFFRFLESYKINKTNEKTEQMAK